MKVVTMPIHDGEHSALHDRMKTWVSTRSTITLGGKSYEMTVYPDHDLIIVDSDELVKS
jgi:hypothetical protein